MKYGSGLGIVIHTSKPISLNYRVDIGPADIDVHGLCCILADRRILLSQRTQQSPRKLPKRVVQSGREDVELKWTQARLTL